MTEADDHRGLIEEAKLLEQRRVEITIEAIDANVADLLPLPWVKLTSYARDSIIRVAFETGLENVDGDRMSDRDCRNFVRFVGQIADMERARVAMPVERHETDLMGATGVTRLPDENEGFTEAEYGFVPGMKPAEHIVLPTIAGVAEPRDLIDDELMQTVIVGLVVVAALLVLAVIFHGRIW